MRKYLGAVVVAAAAAMLTVIPAFASSSAVLSDGAANPNGTDTAVGAVITSGLKSGTNATFFTTATGTTGIKCTTSTTSATVVTNNANPATLSLTAQTFSGCTSNIFGVRSVNSLVLDNLAYNVSIASGGAVTLSPGSSGAIHSSANVTNIFGQSFTCGYHVHASSGNLTGTASNSDNSITFTNQQFDGDSGNNGQCVSTVFFSATYAPQIDSSNGNALVFVN